MNTLTTLLCAAATLVLYSTTTAFAQNKSGEKSARIESHEYIEYDREINCQETGLIEFHIREHWIFKEWPDGTTSVNSNGDGEGIDENSDLWKYHLNFQGRMLDPLELNLIITIQGPKSAKLKARVFYLVTGNGKAIQKAFDPICD